MVVHQFISAAVSLLLMVPLGCALAQVSRSTGSPLVTGDLRGQGTRSADFQR